MHSTEHIEDEQLKALYEEMWREPWRVLQRGVEVLEENKIDDRLAVLLAMREACEAIIEDLEEHGEDNEALYDDNNLDFFEQRQSELQEKIDGAIAAGAESDVYERWKGGDGDDDDAADDIVDEVMGTKGRKLVNALGVAHEDDADGFVAVLGKIGELVIGGEVADHVSAHMQNALIAHFRSSELKGASKIVRGYIDLMAGGYPEGQHHHEAVATCVTIAQVTNDDELAALVIDKLVGGAIEHPRLAFNLACLAAVRGKKEDLLRYTKRALELGKPADEFESDSDFDAFVDDPDFMALLG